jgi:hypothetical protein
MDHMKTMSGSISQEMLVKQCHLVMVVCTHHIRVLDCQRDQWTTELIMQPVMISWQRTDPDQVDLDLLALATRVVAVDTDDDWCLLDTY